MELFILISCVLLLVLNMILIGLHVRSRKNNTAQEVSRSISDLEKVIRDESRYNRENDENRSRKDREELASTLNHFRTEHRETLKNITTQTNSAIQAFQKSFAESMELFNRLQREKFGELSLRQQELLQNTEKKLEEMRATVDEKLQKTLHERIGQSFELVSKQLENVQKGLGEMQTLAQDVGGLKRVLSNVKIRGTIGEVQLSMLLEQILASDQYDTNVKTKPGSDKLVEFAVKLPGRKVTNRSIFPSMPSSQRTFTNNSLMPTNPEICNEWKLLPAYSNRPFAAWQRTSGTNTWPHRTPRTSGSCSCLSKAYTARLPAGLLCSNNYSRNPT